MKPKTLLAAVCLLAATLHADDGPSHVIVTYRVAPDKHGALRSSMASTAGRLTSWRDRGQIGGFTVLTSSFIDDEGWEAAEIIQLSGNGLEMIKRLDHPDSTTLLNTVTVPADLIESGSADGEAPGSGVYLVIPYENAASDDYRTWAKGYLAPLLNASMKEDGLIGFQLFSARFPAGRSWNAMLVLHYRDWPSLGQREALTARLLAANPAWSNYNKAGSWREKVTVIAEPYGAK